MHNEKYNNEMKCSHKYIYYLQKLKDLHPLFQKCRRYGCSLKCLQY